MLPTMISQPTYRTLEEIRQRKDELLEQMQTDSQQFNSIWNSLFVKRDNTSKGDYIASLVTHGVTLIDLFLLVRKLKKNYTNLSNIFRHKR